MKKIILAFVLGGFFIFPVGVEAQGTMTCEFKKMGRAGGRCIIAPNGNNCDSGFVFKCGDLPVGACDGMYSCTASGAFLPFDPTCNLLAPLTGKGIDTALGCLPTDPEAFVGLVLPWAVGIGGGIAFLLMLYGVFMIIISSGVPDKMQAGKELIGSAVAGLLIIIFAVFILKFIGVDVLGLFS